MFKVLNEQEIQEPTGCSYFIRWLLYYINILIHIHPLELCFVDSQSLSCKKSNLAELGQKVLYDDLRRLEQVTKADGSFQKNHYDAEGLRAEMEENGQLVKFLYNENREAVAEEESDGNVIRYIRRLGLISSDSEKAKTYYHYVSDEQGSITHVINGEEKESGELPQEDVQSRVLNHYEYDAFGNTIRCEEQVHNRFHYTGEQYDPLTGQYSLRARYYNPVIAGFTQEDTYYGDGLNLYTYCQNNPILYHDPTGHGTKENSPYSRNEQQYIDVGADPDTARLVAQCYPDAKSKQDLYNKYKKQGYSAQDAKKLANREIIHGEEATKKYIKDNNVKKSDPDYTATSPRDNVNTDWRTQERLNAQRNAGAGKGNESGNKSGKTSNGLPDWLKARFEAGNSFNKENRPRYPYNEVEVYGDGKNYVVDSYIPGSEIVSRKFTQLASVKESTGIGYLNELQKKYPSGAIITDSPFNPKVLRGKTMTGNLNLEIPEQKGPIPQSVIDYANNKGIIIRDVNGKEYN